MLLVDADTVVWGSPDAWLAAASARFAATAETAARGFVGLNTHLVLLAPERDGATFGALLARASECNYLPYTNTEQDVLEAHFTWTAAAEIEAPPADARAPRFPAHWHQNHRGDLDAAEVAKRVASRATRAELDCYRGRDAAARGRLSDDAARARWAAEGFARGEALACCATCAAGRRASSGACSVETEIDPAWLPPPRANALIPDADG